MTENYVDTFVMPVPKSDVAAYQEFAEKMAVIAKRRSDVRQSRAAHLTQYSAIVCR
jgi:uncharacterized protein YbaA (DUF1428 family)